MNRLTKQLLGLGAGTVVAGVVLAGVFVPRLVMSMEGLTAVTVPEVAAELAALQAMPVGCSLSYGRSRRQRRRFDSDFKQVRIQACGERWLSEPIPVPQASQTLYFELERDAVGEPWTVRVDADSAPRSELIGAIRAFAPIIVKHGPPTLATAAAEMARARADADANARAAAAARAANSSSYK